ncbi:MAG: PAS domain-containing protein, partial [Gemmatimonadota bacterium]
QGFVDLGTGRLSVEQLDMLLRHLPIEISFVDADGFVRYYSETEDRLFPRTPGAIGRHVENCHPPKSINMVREILQKFASGERNVAEFWIQIQDKFIHIRYFAVRNEDSVYLGCLEVTQDVTGIRALGGQRRLLEWT